MKCGTTTLYSDLSKLSALHLPSRKEPSILTQHEAIKEIQHAYQEHFQGADTHQLCGEASTNYTKLPIYNGVPEKAYQLCGEHLKLIMIMRDPVDRICSHLRHNISGRKITLDEVDDVVLSDTAYISISNYSMQLEPWIEKFGPNNIYCISLARYKNNREQSIREIASFLNINATRISLENEQIYNKGTELRYTGNATARFLGTRLYRNIIRPLLSDSSRSFCRKLLLPKARYEDIKLSPQVEHELRHRLSHVETDIEKLLGRAISFHAN